MTNRIDRESGAVVRGYVLFGTWYDEDAKPNNIIQRDDGIIVHVPTDWIHLGHHKGNHIELTVRKNPGLPGYDYIVRRK